MSWELIAQDVWLYRDSCNVYGVRGPDGMLIIDAGTGYWLDDVHELPARVSALAITHYFRDHSAGALRAAQAGIPIYVPHFEAPILSDPQQHFRERETYIIYDNLWDLFAPIEGVPIERELFDYETLRIAGLDVEVIPLPGATMTQIGLSVRPAAADKPFVFCGEAVHSPGRIPRVAPLQYNYNDLGGAANVYRSARELRKRGDVALMPSLGDPMLENSDAALAELEASMRTLVETRPGMTWQFDLNEAPALEKITDHVYLSTMSNCRSWFLISDSGKALALDYGYMAHNTGSPGYARAARRRPLLHGIDALKEQFGIDRIDVALISHFHDDHVAGVPLIQRVFGTKVWASEAFADLLSDPSAHCFPCTWPEPIRIDKRIALDETVRWEEYTFRFAPMSGHTRFAALIGFEADGKRYAHTGDQYFWLDPAKPWADGTLMHNYVYRNGALLDGYNQSGEWMLDWRPDIVIQGHQVPFHTDDAFFEKIHAFTSYYRSIHEGAMPLGDDQAHFNLDSWGGWIWPYRTRLDEAGPATVKVTVRNPLPTDARLDVKLVGPTGWVGSSIALDAPPRGEMSCELTITPDGPCRRQPFVAELTVDGMPYGHVCEALLTAGHEHF